MLLSRVVRPVLLPATPIMSAGVESSLSVNEMKRLLTERGVDFRGACWLVDATAGSECGQLFFKRCGWSCAGLRGAV
jgi:hypothetical protein